MDYSSLLERGSLLLRVQPGVRPGQFDHHVREETRSVFGSQTQGAGGLQPKRWPIDVERVADRLDLIPRVETVGLGNLLGDGRALLRRHTCRGRNHSYQQNTDHRNAA